MRLSVTTLFPVILWRVQRVVLHQARPQSGSLGIGESLTLIGKLKVLLVERLLEQIQISRTISLTSISTREPLA
ncbi:MAG: hypothetical protein DCF17_00285 [Shackletoniella antarctica]|uniref:Uncharacterized protein n=1 Tax=Shackletoniella antarctica TaxID=268115 RepID=A0A2W4YEY3_9CYAN|nr:MAG: hypothetical protein DCF17_00285 [Shackletoniella antarctica]